MASTSPPPTPGTTATPLLQVIVPTPPPRTYPHLAHATAGQGCQPRRTVTPPLLAIRDLASISRSLGLMDDGNATGGSGRVYPPWSSASPRLPGLTLLPRPPRRARTTSRRLAPTLNPKPRAPLALPCPLSFLPH